MSRTRRGNRTGRAKPQRITVRGIRRDPLDYRKLSRAILTLAQAQAEADAKAEAEAKAAAEANRATGNVDHRPDGEDNTDNVRPEGGSV